MKRSGKAAWTWADYERCKRSEERRAATLAKREDLLPDAGKMVRVHKRPGAIDKPACRKIDLSGAPSSMELQAESWKGRK